jgi:hypothetical protein
MFIPLQFHAPKLKIVALYMSSVFTKTPKSIFVYFEIMVLSNGPDGSSQASAIRTTQAICSPEI